MPAYTFLCPKCLGGRVVTCKISERNDQQTCECGEVMERQLDTAFVHGSQKGFHNSMEKQIDKTLEGVKL